MEKSEETSNSWECCCTKTTSGTNDRASAEPKNHQPDACCNQRTANDKFSVFDHQTFRVSHCHSIGRSIYTTEFYLEGIHCPSCVRSIEALPKIVKGVIEARLDYARSLLSVAWDSNVVHLSEVAANLDTLGYTPHAVRDQKTHELHTHENRKLLIKIGVAGALAGNTMIVAIAMYAGEFSGIDLQFENLFRWVSLILGWLSLAWPGRTFFQGAITALKTRSPHMDLPIALGLGVGVIAGTSNTFRGHGDIYFDSLTILVFMLLIGRWIQFRQQRKAENAIELLFSLTPASCRLVDENGIHTVPIEILRPGDQVDIRAGESIPADGEIESGSSKVDESLLTGESRPRRVVIGDKISAGSTNLSSSIRCNVQTTGTETRIGRLMKLVEE